MSDAVSREDVVEYLKSQLWIDGFVEVPADELIVAIRALPAVQPAHVNETPKSEHVPGDMLTPATKGGPA